MKIHTCFNTSYVVIKRQKSKEEYGARHVSIHLMLLLNLSSKQKRHFKNGVSIHLMLLLNFPKGKNWEIKYMFQYILCCY